MDELRAVFARRASKDASSKEPSSAPAAAPAAEPLSEFQRMQLKMQAKSSSAPAAPQDVSDAAAATQDTPQVALDKLISSNSIATTQAAYDNILASLGIPTKERSLAKVADALIPQLPHRSKQLLTALQARAAAVAAVAKQPKRRATVAVAIVSHTRPRQLQKKIGAGCHGSNVFGKESQNM